MSEATMPALGTGQASGMFPVAHTCMYHRRDSTFRVKFTLVVGPARQTRFGRVRRGEGPERDWQGVAAAIHHW